MCRRFDEFSHRSGHSYAQSDQNIRSWLSVFKANEIYEPIAPTKTVRLGGTSGLYLSRMCEVHIKI